MSIQLSNIGNIKEILTRHGFTFSKALGQNFLINPSVCPRMADYSIPDKNTCVIEVGPGIGVLTCELARRAERVVAIELDKRLIPVLDETLSEFDNVKIINDDILKIDLEKLIKEEFPDKNVVVCANLPYYITSPVIMKLLEERLPISSLTVMVQKEAAKRVCAEVGTRQCGAVTLAVNYYAKPEILFEVSAGSFMPAPKVDSSVIKLEILPNPPVKADNEELLFRVIKSAFAQRRKTLGNSISSGLSVSKAQISDILADAGVSQNARAEQLTLKQFADIANCLNGFIND